MLHGHVPHVCQRYVRGYKVHISSTVETSNHVLTRHLEKEVVTNLSVSSFVDRAGDVCNWYSSTIHA